MIYLQYFVWYSLTQLMIKIIIVFTATCNNSDKLKLVSVIKSTGVERIVRGAHSIRNCKLWPMGASQLTTCSCRPRELRLVCRPFNGWRKSWREECHSWPMKCIQYLDVSVHKYPSIRTRLSIYLHCISVCFWAAKAALNSCYWVCNTVRPSEPAIFTVGLFQGKSAGPRIRSPCLASCLPSLLSAVQPCPPGYSGCAQGSFASSGGTWWPPGTASTSFFTGVVTILRGTVGW